MDRRQFLRVAALGAAAPFVLRGQSAGARPGRRRRSVVVDQSNLPSPNILFVLTDDQPPHLMRLMEKTLARLSGGADFTDNAYTAVPLCGPARVSLLTGRFQHSHGVFGNDGAFPAFRRAGYPRSDMLSRLKAVGYRMGFMGKYINGYEFHPRYVHPAFGRSDSWVGLADGQGLKNWTVNNNGELRETDQEHTPFFGGWAEAFVRNSASETRPWFCYLNFTDPHLPYKAQDITGSYSSPATEETDLSDKSDFTRTHATRGPDHHRRVHQGQGGEVERLDDRMEVLFRALEKTGQTEHTVVLFSSDNGFLTGEHGGLTKKSMPYGESARTPMLAAGPGFGPGLAEGSPLCSHVDLTYTVCAVAGADTTGLEGRDLREAGSEGWRKRLLVEMISPEGELWSMLREGPYAYTDFRGDVRDKELYDLSADPFETESLHDSPEHAATMAEMSARLGALKNASGEGMRAAEA